MSLTSLHSHLTPSVLHLLFFGRESSTSFLLSQDAGRSVLTVNVLLGFHVPFAASLTRTAIVMNRPRQLLAYGTLSAFLVFIAIFGLADTLSKLYPKGSSNLFGSYGPLIVNKSWSYFSSMPAQIFIYHSAARFQQIQGFEYSIFESIPNRSA